MAGTKARGLWQYVVTLLIFSKALVTRGQATRQTGRRLKASAAFAEGGNIQDVVSALFRADEQISQQLVEQASMHL